MTRRSGGKGRRRHQAKSIGAKIRRAQAHLATLTEGTPEWTATRQRLLALQMELEKKDVSGAP